MIAFASQGAKLKFGTSFAWLEPFGEIMEYISNRQSRLLLDTMSEVLSKKERIEVMTQMMKRVYETNGYVEE